MFFSNNKDARQLDVGIIGWKIHPFVEVTSWVSLSQMIIPAIACAANAIVRFISVSEFEVLAIGNVKGNGAFTCSLIHHISMFSFSWMSVRVHATSSGFVYLISTRNSSNPTTSNTSNESRKFVQHLL